MKRRYETKKWAQFMCAISETAVIQRVKKTEKGVKSGLNTN